VVAIAVVNQKGGVGKTTTAVNLAAYLGALGANVLLVDGDPQGNSSSSLGVPDPAAGLYDVLLRDVPATDVIVPTSTKNVHLLPSTPDLTGAELELHDLDEPNGRLRAALDPLRRQFSYVLLDCPPGLGLLTLNALVSADGVLVPVQCDYLALEGLARLMSTLERVRTGANPRLRVVGILMTMYDGRTMLSQQVVQEVRAHYPRLTFSTVIPRNVRLSEAPSYGVPILQYDPHSRGAEAYAALAVEVGQRAASLAA
jgi:chromosome partitioning protein